MLIGAETRAEKKAEREVEIVPLQSLDHTVATQQSGLGLDTWEIITRTLLLIGTIPD